MVEGFLLQPAARADVLVPAAERRRRAPRPGAGGQAPAARRLRRRLSRPTSPSAPRRRLAGRLPGINYVAQAIVRDDRLGRRTSAAAAAAWRHVATTAARPTWSLRRRLGGVDVGPGAFEHAA